MPSLLGGGLEGAGGDDGGRRLHPHRPVPKEGHTRLLLLEEVHPVREGGGVGQQGPRGAREEQRQRQQ